MPAEFDEYAASYQKLLHDPLRERFAPGSQFFTRRKWELLKGFLSDRNVPTAEQKWLDVGCGLGDLLRLGRSSFQQAVGCDLSPEMLAQVQDLEVRLQNRPDELPYESESFDLVTAVCVYHHVGSKDMRLGLTSEIKRVLRPGAVFCLIEHNPLNPITRLIVRRTPVDANAQLLGISESTQLLRSAGLNVIGKELFLYLPEALYDRASFLESCFRNIPLGGQYALFAEKSA
ncbi:MAG: class I SAM-dependent methyltransferase [Bryobacteraceae bacterium]